MNITFSAPVMVGDLSNRISVSSMQLKSFSVNLAPADGPGFVLVSLTLTDPVSGYDAHFVYSDSTTTATYWQQVAQLAISGTPWMQVLLERLISDGKLPGGAISA